MSQMQFSVAWPEDIDLNDTKPYAFSVQYSTVTNAVAQRTLHRHPSGVLGMPICSGRYGIELPSGLWLVPVRTAIWIPPHVQHNTIQVRGTRSISMHFAPEIAVALPSHPVRYLLNPMTVEMIKHFHQVYGSSCKSLMAKRIARLVFEQLRIAPTLPDSFAPLPENERLRKIFHDLEDPKNRLLTSTELADRVGVSAKTLSRVTASETGMSFGVWRQHIIMMFALESLSEGLTVETIARNSGFDTSSAFIKAFSKIFGMSPGKYQKAFNEGVFDVKDDFPDPDCPQANDSDDAECGNPA